MASAVATAEALNVATKSGVLSLPDRALGDEGTHSLIQSLAETDITSLELRGNHIRSRGAAAIAEMLSSAHCSIHTLSLEWNSIGVVDEGIEILAEGVSKCKSLASLDLRNNKISPRGAACLAHAITATSSPLVRVDLRWNSLGHAGGEALVSALQRNSTILELPLSGNQLRSDDLAAIHTLLKRNRSLASGGHDGVVDSNAAQALVSDDLENDASFHGQGDLQDKVDRALIDGDALRAQLRALRDDLSEAQARGSAEASAHSTTQLKLEKLRESSAEQAKEFAAQVEALRAEVSKAREAKAVAEEARKNTRTEAIAQQLRDEQALADSKEAVAALEEKNVESSAEIGRLKMQVTSLEEKLSHANKRVATERSMRLDTEKQAGHAADVLKQRHDSEMADFKRDMEQRLEQATRREKALSESVATADEDLKSTREEAMRYRLEKQEALDRLEKQTRDRAEVQQDQTLKKLSERLEEFERARDDLAARAKAREDKIASTQAATQAKLSEYEGWLTKERLESADVKAQLDQADAEKAALAAQLRRTEQRVKAAEASHAALRAQLSNARNEEEKAQGCYRKQHDDDLAQIAELQAQLQVSGMKMRAMADAQADALQVVQARVVQSMQNVFVKARQNVFDGIKIGGDAARAGGAAATEPNEDVQFADEKGDSDTASDASGDF